MRYRDDPDACDGLVDRPRSLLPKSKSPKLELIIGGASAPPKPHWHSDHLQKVIDRENNPDRVIRENTALMMLDELEARALDNGRNLLLARCIVAIETISRRGYEAAQQTVGPHIVEAVAAYSTLGTRDFNEALRCFWYSHSEADAAEFARIQGVLRDVAV